MDKKADKRDKLVRQLLDREDDFAAHWLSFWNDALRNDYTGPGYITGGRFNITNWLYNSIKTNKPYPQFVKELVDPVKNPRDLLRASNGAVKSMQVNGQRCRLPRMLLRYF